MYEWISNEIKYMFHHTKRNTEEEHVLYHLIRSYSNLLYWVIVLVLEKFTYFSNIREGAEWTKTSHNFMSISSLPWKLKQYHFSKFLTCF